MRTKQWRRKKIDVITLNKQKKKKKKTRHVHTSCRKFKNKLKKMNFIVEVILQANK